MTPAQRAAAEKAIFDVGSLHQARYVLFDNGTRLLVATTFDGDWDVYIDDFAASYILDAWDAFLIHCEGYPDEGKASLTVEEIKEFLTANQVTASDLYITYPGVTAKEIQKALRVDTAFQQVLDTPAPPRRSSTRPEAAPGAGGQLTPRPSPGWRRADGRAATRPGRPQPVV